MCRIDDGETTECWSEKHRTARKEHVCHECRRSIAKGEAYWYASGVTSRRGWDAKTCAHCHVISDWLSANCHGFVHSQQVEDLGEHAEANLPMLRIVVGARRQWKAFADPSALLPVPMYPPDMTA